MGGGPTGEMGNKGGVGDGEGGGCGSYRPCRTVEHLIVLSGSLGVLSLEITSIPLQNVALSEFVF